jgi:hypothetical protein
MRMRAIRRLPTKHSTIIIISYSRLQIVRVLGEKESERIANVPREALQWLYSFLLPFKEETDKLQGEQYPTLPLVLPATAILRKHCMVAGQLVPANMSPKQFVPCLGWSRRLLGPNYPGPEDDSARQARNLAGGARAEGAARASPP